jgi:hypothetical protein
MTQSSTSTATGYVLHSADNSSDTAEARRGPRQYGDLSDKRDGAELIQFISKDDCWMQRLLTAGKHLSIK